MAEEEKYVVDLTARDLGQFVLFESQPSQVAEVRAIGTLKEVLHTDEETRITIGDPASPTVTISIIDGIRNTAIIKLGDPLGPHWGLGL